MSTATVLRILFPAVKRTIPFGRFILNFLRALHLVFISLLVGSLFFQQTGAESGLWITGILVSGFLMLLLEFYGSAQILFEIRGISILVKLVFLALIPYSSHAIQISIVIGVIFMSSIISHASRTLRHRYIGPKHWLPEQPHD